MELRALRAAQRTAQWRAALACLAELRRRQALREAKGPGNMGGPAGKPKKIGISDISTVSSTKWKKLLIVTWGLGGPFDR